MSQEGPSRIGLGADSETRRIAGAGLLSACVVLVCAGYYAGGWLGIALTFPPIRISSIWPPNAILLAALLLAPARTWWAFLLATFPTHLHLVTVFQPGVPMPTMLSQFAGNAAQAVVAAIAVRRFVGAPPRFDSLRGMTRFILLAGIVAPAVASALAISLFMLTGWATEFWVRWGQRFLTNVFPSLTIPPLILALIVGGSAKWWRQPPRRYTELGLLTVGLFAVGLPVFGMEAAGPGSYPALLYAPLPFLLWAAVRFGPAGTCFALLVVALLSLANAFAGRGPFVTRSPIENVVSLQIFQIGISVPLLLLAALVQERRRTEESLRESQARLALAHEAGQVAAFDWFPSPDASVGPEDRKALAGLPPGGYDWSSDTWLERIHPDDRARVHEDLRRTLVAGDLSVEFRVIWSDGSVHWLHARGMAHRDADGRPVRVVGVHVDVTERRRADEALRRAQAELAHAARLAALGQLTASIAHEVNQPLAAIIANARAGLRWLAGGSLDPVELRAAWEDVAQDARRASEVIQRVRGLLRKSPTRPAPLDVNSVVHEVVALVRSELAKQRVSLRMELADPLAPVQGDRVQLQQVLLNLFVNGIEAMSGVAGHPRELIVRSRTDDTGGVLVVVRDSGGGLDPKSVEVVFEPFYTTKADGMGMGLSICRSIIESHGGRLWAASNGDGPGATFCFTLPAGGPETDERAGSPSA
jgi:two-component system, LuxR family, sensor kinase FixL